MASCWLCVSKGNIIHTCTHVVITGSLSAAGISGWLSCIFFPPHSNRLYSGSADCTIIVSLCVLPLLGPSLENFTMECFHTSRSSFICIMHFPSNCASCVGVGHSDAPESQYYPCPWQPRMHTGLLPQHVVQRLPQGHQGTVMCSIFHTVYVGLFYGFQICRSRRICPNPAQLTSAKNMKMWKMNKLGL